MSAKDIAFDNEILRGVVGSTVHGTAIEGQDDRDEMGIFIESARAVCGWRAVDHYIYRDKPEGVRSEAGDLDLTLYSLRKFCRLAAQGNPSVVILFWLPEYIVKTPLGERLIGIRDAFISRESGKRFLGYLTSQKMKLTGEKSKTVNRPELVERHGYDTKFAMHALRLGLQGIEYLTAGQLSLPMREPDLTRARAVRTGQVSFEGALAMIEDAETELRRAVDACERSIDLPRIEGFLVDAHRTHWDSQRSKGETDGS